MRLLRSQTLDLTDAAEDYDATRAFPDDAAETSTTRKATADAAEGRVEGNKVAVGVSKAVVIGGTVVVALFLMAAGLFAALSRDAPGPAPRAAPKPPERYYQPPVKRSPRPTPKRGDRAPGSPQRTAPSAPRRQRERPTPVAPVKTTAPVARPILPRVAVPGPPRRRADDEELPGVVEPSEGSLVGSHVTGARP